MNYVNIMGGLGNQLFQYTFAKYLEKSTGDTVLLHTGLFNVDTANTEFSSRKCALDYFNTQYQSTDKQVTFSRVITDDTFDMNSISDNTFFNGYWQDKRFLTAVYDSISGELKLKNKFITKKLVEIASEMRSCDSVAIHVRRKDYLNQYNKDIFYNISVEYYALAVRKISETIGQNPVLYIFSDDYDYIRSNMSNFCNCYTVLMPPRKDYEDLYLMSQAKHHIIANSTYSWWGSILSEYNNGITIAPRHWFKDRKDSDLYPDNWIIMDNQVSLDKISVIVPAYNVENYVRRCLLSIEQQTYDIKNLEIILINDASTDNTLAHLEWFESKYPDNVILIKLQENRGLSAARNIGLEYATGEYITFIDSDDFIDVSMLYKMASKIKEFDCDYVECGYKKFSNDNEAVIINDLESSFYLDLNNVDSRKNLILLNCSKTSVWGRLYKQQFINKNRLRFIEHLYFEDIPFSGLAMFVASSYYRINETLYYYFTNTDGIVFSTYKKERVHHEVAAVERFLSELLERNLLTNILDSYNNELIIYCTTKAFVDPLTLLINSTLGLKELLYEIEYFKERLLDIFPDAALSYNLSDEYGICQLAIRLLTLPASETAQLLTDISEESVIMINLSGNHFLLSDLPASLSKKCPDISGGKCINISRSLYAAEHLLIRHAINIGNSIIINSGEYSDISDQKETNRYIMSIISEYPNNHIILIMEKLYYEESDECLHVFSELIECLTAHNDLILLLSDKSDYKVGCVLMPSVEVYLI